MSRSTQRTVASRTRLAAAAASDWTGTARVMRVLVLGGLSFDTVVYLEEFPRPAPHTVSADGFHDTIGETGAGKTLNLRKLGFDVTFQAHLGADALGDRVAAGLEEERIVFIREPDARGTRRHVNLMDRLGGRISIILPLAGPSPTFDRRRMEGLLPSSEYVVVNIDNPCRELIAPIKAAGHEIWCDIHDYDGSNPYHQDFITAADYLFLSSDLLTDYRLFMRRMLTQGKRLVVCTHGRGGSTGLSADGEWFDVPSLPDVPTRDTNGAGDAFFAGYLYGHARSYPILRCLQLGTIVGGLCVASSELAAPELTPELLDAMWARHYAGGA